MSDVEREMKRLRAEVDYLRAALTDTEGARDDERAGKIAALQAQNSAWDRVAEVRQQMAAQIRVGDRVSVLIKQDGFIRRGSVVEINGDRATVRFGSDETAEYGLTGLVLLRGDQPTP